MNFLPFVIIIIVVFSLFSLTQFEGAIAHKKEFQLYRAYFEGLRVTRNQKEKSAREAKKPRTQTSTPKNQNSQKTKTYPYFREDRVGWDKGRLNLSSLLTNPHMYEGLTTLAENYVKRLYGRAHFFPKDENFSKELIQALCAAYKDKETPPPFYEITFPDPVMQNIFYKMVHGTQTYDLEEPRGYPPFASMFTFEKSNEPPMQFHYANLAFLSLLLGEKVKQELVTLEKELIPDSKPRCRSPLKPPDVQSFILCKIPHGGEQILKFFELNYKGTKRLPKKHVDEETALTVKVK